MSDVTLTAATAFLVTAVVAVRLVWARRAKVRGLRGPRSTWLHRHAGRHVAGVR